MGGALPVVPVADLAAVPFVPNAENPNANA